MLMKRTMCVVLTCTGLSVQAHAQSEVKPKIYDGYEFQGLVVPGTALDAKKTGFTNCAFSVYSGYICKRDVPGLVYGVALGSAEVTLNDEAHFSGGSVSVDKSKLSEVPIDQLSYGSVSVKFSGDGEQAFKKKLKADGWVEQSRRYYEYYKRGVNVKITITRWGTTFYPTTAKEANEVLDRLEKENQERAIKDGAVKKAQDFMKS